MKIVKNIFEFFLDCLNCCVHSNRWVGVLWIGLGLSTWLTSPWADALNIVAPIIVGVASFLRNKIGDAFYYSFAFATAADRVGSYLLDGVWNPLFVWLLVGTYIPRVHKTETKEKVKKGVV